MLEKFNVERQESVVMYNVLILFIYRCSRLNYVDYKILFGFENIEYLKIVL